MFVNFYDVVEDAEARIWEELANAKRDVDVRADEIGLDPRAGRVFVTKDAIVVSGRTGPIEYYGGFEYVDETNTATVGAFTIYFSNDERVEKAIDYYFNR